MSNVAFCETRTWVGSGVRRCNEDYAHMDAHHGFAVLVDGATGLTKTNLVAGESDASWYARTLCLEAARLLEDPDANTREALSAAARAVATTYLELPGARLLSREDLPNGSLALLRWDEVRLEVTMLGDCTAAILMRDGGVRVVHDPTLDVLDQENYERMYRHARAHDTTMAEARRAVNPYFIKNRLRMNEPGGYWAADVTCRGFGHELQQRFPLREVAGFFACSDGFKAAVDMGVVSCVDELAERVLAGEGAVVAQALREAEQRDADCWRVHRSKTSDDATYVALRFS